MPQSRRGLPPAPPRLTLQSSSSRSHQSAWRQNISSTWQTSIWRHSRAAEEDGQGPREDLVLAAAPFVPSCTLCGLLGR